ncbi:MAG: hypothetical protein K8L99_14055 [Anaerolineae bacterium]|nr:hypothetical protein [Anaerolineae bacterium]
MGYAGKTCVSNPVFPSELTKRQTIESGILDMPLRGLNMDTNTLVVLIIFVALILFVAFRYRQSLSAIIKLPFASLDVRGTNQSLDQQGIKAKSISSRQGGILMEDSTGHGIDAENVDAEKDIRMTSQGTYSDPKA